jgi:hypothetical protein
MNMNKSLNDTNKIQDDLYEAAGYLVQTLDLAHSLCVEKGLLEPDEHISHEIQYNSTKEPIFHITRTQSDIPFCIFWYDSKEKQCHFHVTEKQHEPLIRKLCQVPWSNFVNIATSFSKKK